MLICCSHIKNICERVGLGVWRFSKPGEERRKKKLNGLSDWRECLKSRGGERVQVKKWIDTGRNKAKKGLRME